MISVCCSSKVSFYHHRYYQDHQQLDSKLTHFKHTQPPTAIMKFSVVASLLAATGISAAPAQQKAGKDVKAFHLMSLRSASPIHFGSFSAAESNIYINYPKGKQGATCKGDAEGLATFSLKDGGLFLYNKDTKQQQQVFVDRSGMGKSWIKRERKRVAANVIIGQGKIGYISKGQHPPRNSELKGWTSEKNGDYDYLQFDGASLLACPAATKGAYSVWLSAGVENPGGNKGCLGLSAMVQPDDKPVSCKYT